MRSLGVPFATLVKAVALPCLAAACPFLAGCRAASPPPPPGGQSALRFGIFAADATGSDEERASRYRPVADYFEASLGRPIALVVSADPGRILADFESGQFDAVFHRAIAFPHAQVSVGAVPLVTRQEDRHLTTVFLAAASDPRQSLQDFRGARLDFSLRLGSSYVMGRHYLEQQHIDAPTFFGDVHFSNVADEAIGRVLRGQADICVANSQALTRMVASGALPSSAIKIVAETPPHVGQLWFVSNDLPKTVRTGLRDAFLSLSSDDLRDAVVLKLLGASGYLPVVEDDYRELTDLMRQMQLLDFDVRQLP